MSDFNWCHGSECHEKRTLDRIRGTKGNKVLRTRKIPINNWNRNTIHAYFCSQQCERDFWDKNADAIRQIAPRTEALETPIEVVEESRPDYYGNPYKTKVIKEVVDNAS